MIEVRENDEIRVCASCEWTFFESECDDEVVACPKCNFGTYRFYTVYEDYVDPSYILTFQPNWVQKRLKAFTLSDCMKTLYREYQKRQVDLL